MKKVKERQDRSGCFASVSSLSPLPFSLSPSSSPTPPRTAGSAAGQGGQRRNLGGVELAALALREVPQLERADRGAHQAADPSRIASGAFQEVKPPPGSSSSPVPESATFR